VIVIDLRAVTGGNREIASPAIADIAVIEAEPTDPLGERNGRGVRAASARDVVPDQGLIAVGYRGTVKGPTGLDSPRRGSRAGAGRFHHQAVGRGNHAGRQGQDAHRFRLEAFQQRRSRLVDEGCLITAYSRIKEDGGRTSRTGSQHQRSTERGD